MRRLVCVLLSATLALGAWPASALAEVAPAADASASADASSSSRNLEEGTYVEGEAIVLYHAEPAEEAVGEAQAVLASDDGGDDAVAGLLADEAADVAGASAFALEGFSVTEAWDLSAPDDGAALASADEGAATSSSASSTTPGTQPNADDADLRIARVAKDGASTQELIDELSALDYVVSAEPNQVCTVDSATPNDSYYEIWQSSALADASSSINLDALIEVDDDWSTAATGSGETIVAVIDRGVDFSNPDLANMAWTNPGIESLPGAAGSHGYDFGAGDDDPTPETVNNSQSHGTHVAGIIAAEANNGQGVAGVAQSTKIMALKVASHETGDLLFSAAISSYEYVVKALLAGQNVVAINDSFGFTEYSAVFDYAVNQAGKLGALSIASSGNDGGDALDSAAAGLTCIESPYLIVVAASNQYNELASFSDYNSTLVDLASPGANILSTVATDDVASSKYWNALLAKQRLGTSALLYYDDFQSFGSDDAGYSWFIRTSYGEDADDYFIDAGAATSEGLVSFSTDSTLLGEPALTLTLDGDALEDYMQEHVDASWTAEECLMATSIELEREVTNPFQGMGLTSLDDYRLSSTASIVNGDAQAQVMAANEVFAVDGEGDEVYFAEDSEGSYSLSEYDGGEAGASFSPDALLDESSFELLNQSDTLHIGFSLMFVSTGDALAARDGSHCLMVKLTGLGIGHKSTYQPYALMEGTSMATPMVTGALAELAALYPSESALELRGRIVGSTVATAKYDEDDDRQTATDGRFSFGAGALDGSGEGISANTWSAEVDVATGTVTLYGRGLGDASVVGDDGAALEVDSRAEDGSWVKVRVGASLFDGASHRFDVSDDSTGKTHRAAYIMPSADAQAVGGELAKAIDLPEGSAGSASGRCVSTPAGMVFADARGTYAYICADPSAEGASWEQLAAPGLPWGGNGSVDLCRTDLSYGYAGGRLYAFCTDGDGAGGLVVWATTLDLAAGSAGSWSAWEQVGSYELPFYEYCSTYIEPEAGMAALANGRLYSYVRITEHIYSYLDGEITTNGKLLLLSADAGTSEFTQEVYGYDDIGVLSVTGLVGGSSLRVVGRVGELGSQRLGFFELDEASGSWTGVAETNDSLLADVDSGQLVGFVTGATGDGIVIAGKDFGSYGDLVLIDAGTGEVSSLGSYGLLASGGYVVEGLQVMGGVLYVCAIDTSAGAAGDASEGAAGDASEGLSLGALYTLPASAQARVTSTDAELVATVGAGAGADAASIASSACTAAVADWRGGAQATQAVRLGDAATWTAATASGYAFAGWYDEAGELVSTEASYTQLVTGARALEARFARSASGGDSGGEPGGEPGGDSGGDSGGTSENAPDSTPASAPTGERGRGMPKTGDDTNYALIGGLAAAAAALVAAGLRRRR